MFKVYLLVSGVSELSPDHRKALLLHSQGPEVQRIFNTMSVSQAAGKTVEEKGTAATPAATPDVYDCAVAALAKPGTRSSIAPDFTAGFSPQASY